MAASHMKADSRPSAKKLQRHVIPYVAANWYELGLELLDEKDEHELNNIKATCGSDVKKSCLEMFLLWLNTNNDAKWCQIVDALKSPGVNLSSIAVDLERKLSDQKDQSMDKQLVEKDEQLSKTDQQLVQKDELLTQKHKQLLQKDQQLIQTVQQLAQKDQQLAQLAQQLIQRDQHLKQMIKQDQQTDQKGLPTSDGSDLVQYVNSNDSTEVAANPSKLNVSASGLSDKRNVIAESENQKRKNKTVADPSRRSIPYPPGYAPDRKDVSEGSVENERYSLDAQPCSDHDNEDEYMVYSNKHSLCMCVFDGHDGSHTVKFMKKYMNEQVFSKPLWNDITKSSKPKKIEAALANYIQKADDHFFESIEVFIRERQQIQTKMPKGLLRSEHQAQQRFPVEVARLKALESHISGGCTAVVALLTSDRLYIANVGDSRAILVYKNREGSLQVKQLSVDHGVDNEQELERLTALGLDRKQLKKSGKLGTQKNTRSIGDYILKGGYKDMDILCHATDQPGIAVPHVISVDIDHYTFKYVIVMSDGVYKTLEAIDGGDTGKSGNDILVDMIEQHTAKMRWNEVPINILQEIRETQYNLYQISASKDVCSPMAIANRKRDDMTLVIYKFDVTV